MLHLENEGIPTKSMNHLHFNYHQVLPYVQGMTIMAFLLEGGGGEYRIN